MMIYLLEIKGRYLDDWVGVIPFFVHNPYVAVYYALYDTRAPCMHSSYYFDE
jgi:hypothetical protein